MAAAISAKTLVLASQSPRRVELLRDAGFSFDIQVPDVEEAHDAALSPAELTLENARRKALRVAIDNPGAIVVGADTLVYVDGEPLAKPADMEEARAMLRRLSGRWHEVCTGVVLAQAPDVILADIPVITRVHFKPLDEDAITAYHQRCNPLDKAGGYGIQDAPDIILHEIDGSWSNVVGLPVERVIEALIAHGIAPLANSA
ncbi:MAG: septum formation protein Maf [Verrucomicrobiales bacterium]|nr:septum formation protein Maf [Verrucomicrobiales bacterium]MCP5559955.1 septum formation protein Maf [Verrucomicrobiaceae bacterium]